MTSSIASNNQPFRADNPSPNAVDTPKTSNNTREVIITILSCVLIAGAITLWTFIIRNQIQLSVTQRKITQLQNELTELSDKWVDSNRISEILNELNALNQRLAILKSFPMNTLLPLATVSSVAGIIIPCFLNKKSATPIKPQKEPEAQHVHIQPTTTNQSQGSPVKLVGIQHLDSHTNNRVSNGREAFADHYQFL